MIKTIQKINYEFSSILQGYDEASRQNGRQPSADVKRRLSDLKFKVSMRVQALICFYYKNR